MTNPHDDQCEQWLLLTVKQIHDLFGFTGGAIETKMTEMDHIDAEYIIEKGKDGKIYAYNYEYPEEGAIVLGEGGRA